jgi:predicted permease
VHAAGLGLLVNQTGYAVPKALAVPIELLGQTVVPLMLLTLGARLRGLVGTQRGRALPVGPILLLVLLRFGGGFVAAIGVNAALGNTGVAASVLLLTGVLPPAVMSFALVEKYGEDPQASGVVSAAIAVGTALALVVLPLAVQLARAVGG